MCQVTKFPSILMVVCHCRSKSNLLINYFFKHDKCPTVIFFPLSGPQPQSRSQIWEVSPANEYNYLGYPCIMACSTHCLGFWVCVYVLHVWMHLSVNVYVNVYGGKGDRTRKSPSWNLLCLRYHATFIHIAFSHLAGGGCGGGWRIGWGRGVKGGNMSVLFMLLCCLEFLHRSKALRCCPRNSWRPTNSNIQETADFLNTASLPN